jgi:hypothetical protein
MDSMIHAKLCQPRIFPQNSARQPEQINRAQDIGGDLTLSQDKLFEIGRDGKLGVKKNIPTLAYPLTQYEYGSMDFWYALANVINPVTGADKFIELDDLTTTMVEISAYLTDEDNIFKGTIWFPKLRVAGFSLNIGDPNAAVQRKFDLVGEDFKILPTKYFAYAEGTVGVLGTGVDYTLHFGATGEAPIPIAYSATEYIFKVLRIRSGICTELVETLDWSYSDGTKLLTVLNCLTSDLIKVYYEAATAYATLWADNNTDPDALFAEDCVIYMKCGNGTESKIYLLQSVGIDVALERDDKKQIGSTEVAQTGVKGKTVTVKLDRFNAGFSLETLLASDTVYPYINPRDFSDEIQLRVEIYKKVSGVAVFAMGYLITGLSPTALGTSQAIEDYNKVTNSLESDNLKISSDLTELAFITIP